MNLDELQAELRHFAAERDWQPFHTPKNLSTALLVEAAELAEVFQWKTPEESQAAHADTKGKQRIGEEVADVLLYLLQLADHCQIDIQQAVRDKLAKNAAKYPAKKVIERGSQTRSSVSGTHVLLDYENVQPSDAQLRALVPKAGQVWVFHGPHQREVEKRFSSFGPAATAVPISKTGKNALDFHLSFYMGYIASRNPDSTMVVVANDKGYDPMLEHAKAMGFVVRRQPHGEVKTPAKMAAVKTVATKKVPAAAAKKASAKPAAKKQPAAKKVVAKTQTAKQPVPARKPATAKKIAAKAPARVANAGSISAAHAPSVVSEVAAKSVLLAPGSAATLEKLVNSLRRMGDKRPTKPVSLWRSLKSFLGTGATEESVEAALARLIEDGVVKVDSVQGASYPKFDPGTRTVST